MNLVIMKFREEYTYLRFSDLDSEGEFGAYRLFTAINPNNGRLNTDYLLDLFTTMKFL